jgi:hypothetical protein
VTRPLSRSSNLAAQKKPAQTDPSALYIPLVLVTASVVKIYFALAAAVAAYLLWSTAFTQGRRHVAWIIRRLRRSPQGETLSPGDEVSADEPAGLKLEKMGAPAVLRSPERSEPVSFQPRFLMGRLLPGALTTWITSDEQCLLVRAGIAATTPTDPEPKLGTSEQEAFEDATASSSLEVWCRSIEIRDAASDASAWEPIDPTETRIVTLARPSVEMMPGGWKIEGRSAITTRPGVGSLGPQGWLLLHTGIVIRPPEASLASKPLSLSDFHDLLWVLTTSLVAEVGPAVLPDLCGRPDPIFSFECIVLPQRDLLGKYTEVERPGWRRVEGMRDASGGDFNPSSLVEIQDEGARIKTTRSWVAEILRNSGNSRHEDDVSRLEPPRLRRT